MKYARTPANHRVSLWDYASKHIVPHSLRDDIYVVNKPLKTFKKVVVPYNYDHPRADARAIANLIVPVGALIYLPKWLLESSCGPNEAKIRVSVAKVHSIVGITSGLKYKKAESWYLHAKTLEYKPGNAVVPRNNFSLKNEQCAAGIHCFLTVEDAVEYYL